MTFLLPLGEDVVDLIKDYRGLFQWDNKITEINQEYHQTYVWGEDNNMLLFNRNHPFCAFNYRKNSKSVRKNYTHTSWHYIKTLTKDDRGDYSMWIERVGGWVRVPLNFWTTHRD